MRTPLADEAIRVRIVALRRARAHGVSPSVGAPESDAWIQMEQRRAARQRRTAAQLVDDAEPYLTAVQRARLRTMGAEL